MRTKRTADMRVRFGWAAGLGSDPQRIFEGKGHKDDFPVAVIPLPFMSGKQRKIVRDFAKGLHPA